MKMNDKDILTELLTREKALVNEYASMINEASNKQIRTTLKSCFEVASDTQFEVFAKMSSRSMYPTESVDQKKLTEAKTKFDTAKKELDSN